MLKKRKQIYMGEVKRELKTFVYKSKHLPSYNLLASVVNYYEQTIMVDKVITEKEFLQLCKEVSICQMKK